MDPGYPQHTSCPLQLSPAEASFSQRVSLEMKGLSTLHHHWQTISLFPPPAPTEPLLAILLSCPLPIPCYSPACSQSLPLPHKHLNSWFPASFPPHLYLRWHSLWPYIHPMTHPAAPKFPDLITTITCSSTLPHASVTRVSDKNCVTSKNLNYKHAICKYHLLSPNLPALTGSESA